MNSSAADNNYDRSCSAAARRESAAPRRTREPRFTQSLANGFQPTMIVMGVICVVAALIAALFVTDGRPSSPRVVPHAGEHGGAFPIPDPVTP